jgi:hypothetical protein
VEDEREPQDIAEALGGFDPDLAEAAFEGEDEDEVLLDLLSDRLDDVHPRLTRSFGEGWHEDDGGPAA